MKPIAGDVWRIHGSEYYIKSVGDNSCEVCEDKRRTRVVAKTYALDNFNKPYCRLLSHAEIENE